MLRWILGNPLLAGAVLAAAAGWTYAGWQTIQYQSTLADLQATKAQVALDANQAAQVTIAALQKSHAREMAELTAQLAAHRQAVTEAQTENQRLSASLTTFQRELEGLHNAPEIHDYLALPVPAGVIERLRDAQNRDQTASD